MGLKTNRMRDAPDSADNILLADYGRYTRDINRDPYLHFQEIPACDSEDEARYICNEIQRM